MSVEKDGNAYGVFLLNSNAMGRLIRIVHGKKVTHVNAVLLRFFVICSLILCFKRAGHRKTGFF